ncbi:MAG: DNA methylase [Candidatus Peregrinibacteria bacterium Gr01-1014_25]|nr:MAG: DNA methylase [Candidatus Peregrinibacteria bacterium Gr01-1014_25]
MKNPLIKSGDLFTLGRHRLACGDCRDPALVARLTDGKRIGLILTDPPYGVAYVEGKAGFQQSKTVHKPIANDQLQSDDEYRAFTRAWLEAVRPHLARKNAIYCFNSDKMLFPLRNGLLDAGWKFAQLLIWAKTAAVIGRLDYLPMHECIAYGWHGVHEFYKAKDKSILVYPKPTKSVLHSTMKPVGLLRRLILNSTRSGDGIFDGFAGSGSTLIAAEQTQRQCFAMELSLQYCQVILERFQKVTGIVPLKLHV